MPSPTTASGVSHHQIKYHDSTNVGSPLMRDMSTEEMIEVLNDPDRRLGWRGTPAGPQWEEKAREWAFGIFASWNTERQLKHLLDVGVDEATDILSMATESDGDDLLSLFPREF